MRSPDAVTADELRERSFSFLGHMFSDEARNLLDQRDKMLHSALYECTAAIIDALPKHGEAVRLREALEAIQVGGGAFSRDPLTHAGNCIKNMKKIATDALSADAEEESK